MELEKFGVESKNEVMECNCKLLGSPLGYLDLEIYTLIIFQHNSTPKLNLNWLICHRGNSMMIITVS